MTSIKVKLRILVIFYLLIYNFQNVKSDNIYPWESSRTTWLECKDMVLLYGGGSHRNYQWDAQRIAPYITYTDKEGNEHWMFDSFLFLEIKDGTGVSFATGYTNTPARQTDWRNLVNYFFQKNYTAGAINKAIENASKRIGQPPVKRKLIIGIPEPIKTLTDWGTIDNGRTLNFTNTQDRIDACKWYIDYVRQKFNDGNYEHLELAGFYWIAEEASNSRTITAPIAQYINDLKYSYNWIPYFNSPGWKEWTALKFNYAYLQPNYFFKEPLIEDRLDAACVNALSENMDMELEFDERILTKNNAWHYRLENYIKTFEKYEIWENKRIAYYQGSKALYELSISSDTDDRAIYHRFCEKVIQRTSLIKKKTHIDWTYCNAEENLNNFFLYGSNIPLISTSNSTTRNFTVGKLDKSDRVFIFTRAGDNKAKILIYNSETGDYIDSLKTGGIISQTGSGNLVSIGDGGITEDGVLLLSNVVGPVADNFKIYKWSSEFQPAPEVAINYNTKNQFPTGRFGDKIHVTGRIDDGTAKVFATNKVAGRSKIIYWSMLPKVQQDGFVFDNNPKELFPVTGKSIQSSLATNENNEFYYKESELQIVKYNANGDSVDVSSSDIIRDWGTSIKYITQDGNDDIIAYFKYRSKAKAYVEYPQEKADILRLPNGSLNNAQIIATTPSLGSEYNLNGWGDIFARRKDKNIEIFVLSATNGIGKYTIKDIFKESTSTNRNYSNKVNLLVKKHNNNLIVCDINPSSMILLSITGKVISTVYNSNEISINNLSGLFILQVISDNHQSYNTLKVLL